MIRPTKNICVFPIAWSSKSGSVGRDFVFCLFGFFFKSTSMLLPLKSHKLVSFFLTGFKHQSNVQGNEENSSRKLVFNKSISIKRSSESVNIATVKRLLLKSETNTEIETNFQILSIYYVFWHKKC